jgi:transcriptional regulator with XRE-family HTH domain
MDTVALQTWLKELRQDAGLDIREFAKESNFASAQVNRIENGKAGLTLDALIHFAYGLGISLEDVLQKIELPLLYSRYKGSRKPKSEQPIPTIQDVHALWQFFREEPQKVKQIMVSGFTEVQQVYSKSGQMVDQKIIADQIWEATQALSDKFFPLPFPPEFNYDLLMEIYVCGGVITIKDVSAFVRSSRQAKGLSLRELARVTGISNAAISRFENHQVERIFFSQVMDFDSAMNLDGQLVSLAWDAAEYEAGITLHKMLSDQVDERLPLGNWDPVRKAFSDTLITICRWYYASGGDQTWWKNLKGELAFYYP